MTTCNRCGKLLTDPVSVSVGYGAVCYAKIKTEMSQDKNGNLFASRSSYEWKIDGGIVAIEDLDNGMSVTNDMENVLNDIREELSDPANVVNKLNNCRIMYRDSAGIWDGVKVVNGSVVFLPIQEKNYHAAKEKLLAIRNYFQTPQQSEPEKPKP